jgi:Zn-dependent protease
MVHRRCQRCGTELAASLLRCPACLALVHASRLETLAREAQDAESGGQYAIAAERWHEALTLLPAGAAQMAAIEARLTALEPRLQQPGMPRKVSGSNTGGFLAAVGAVVLLLLTKAKFLLFGLTKLSTLLSMLAFFGLYWGVWGWKFAAGFALSIYIHEMGHVFALRRYGIPASAPMFIPGIGALIRLKAYPRTAGQDARVGLAGPLWGLGAAGACYLIFLATHAEIWGALAHVGAVINLFNLTPVWQLDGARGIRPLNRTERIALLILTVGCFVVVREGFLLLVALVLGWQCFRDAPGEGDRPALHLFAFILLALSALASVRVM